MSRLLRSNANKFEVDQPTSSWSRPSRFLESRGTVTICNPRCGVSFDSDDVSLLPPFDDLLPAIKMPLINLDQDFRIRGRRLLRYTVR
jgi:hypothetical protein